MLRQSASECKDDEHTHHVRPAGKQEEVQANVGATSGSSARVEHEDVPSSERTFATGPNSERTFASVPSSAAWPEQTLASGVNWLWEHTRTQTFRSYRAHEVARIEAAYRRGAPMVRLKGGKTGAQPMEVWFTDMMQYNPDSNNKRGIQRLGASRRWQRFFAELAYTMANGTPWRQTQQEHAHPELCEEDLYRKGAICTRIVTHYLFLHVTVVAIILNSMWIFIDANRHDADKEVPTYAMVIECVFCVFFIIEISLRLGAVGRLQVCLWYNSFRMDTALALLMPVDFIFSATVKDKSNTGKYAVLRIARMFRITRLGRIAKLLRLVPEIAMLMKGILTALKSVFCTILLLFVLLFVFAVMFKEQSAGYQEVQETFFPTIARSAWNLLLLGLLDDPAGTIAEIADHSGFLAFLFVVFVFVTNYTVMNLFAGILFDVVCQVKGAEEERAEITKLKTNLIDIIEVYDRDDNQRIHQRELDLLLQNGEIKSILKRTSVDAQQVELLCGHIIDSAEDESVTFEEFINVFLALRAENPNDLIVELRQYLTQRFDAILERIDGSLGSLGSLGGEPQQPVHLTQSAQRSQDALDWSLNATKEDERQNAKKNTEKRKQAFQPELPTYVQAAVSSLQKYAATEEGGNEEPNFHLGLAILNEWIEERV